LGVGGSVFLVGGAPLSGRALPISWPLLENQLTSRIAQFGFRRGQAVKVLFVWLKPWRHLQAAIGIGSKWLVTACGGARIAATG